MNARDESEKIKGMYKDFEIGTLDNATVWLRVPSFDCDWYWGFGHLGNRNCYFRLNCLHSVTPTLRGTHRNMHDSLLDVFGDSLTIRQENLWEFCEVAETIYGLKHSAEIFGYGGSSYTVQRINDVLIPTQIHLMYKILYTNNEEK